MVAEFSTILLKWLSVNCINFFLSIVHSSLNANQITFNTENVVFEFSQQIQSPQPQQIWESVPATSHFQLKSLGWVDRNRLNVTANNSSSLVSHGRSIDLNARKENTAALFTPKGQKRPRTMCFHFLERQRRDFFSVQTGYSIIPLLDLAEHLDFPHW